MNDPLVDDILRCIPAALRDLPGTALYSGRDACAGPSEIYVLGLNPGGPPEADTLTVSEQVTDILAGPPGFSKYVHEQWATPKGRLLPAGDHPHQVRIRHLLRTLHLDPGSVPASNLVFVRSRRESDIPANDMYGWAEVCWPFHAAMIERSGAKVVLCLGETAGEFVRAKVGAHTEVDRFVEANGRRWSSIAYSGAGVTVLRLTHPSIADWTNPATDVSPLVARALDAATA